MRPVLSPTSDSSTSDAPSDFASSRAVALWPSLLASACLAAIALLACAPSVQSTSADRAALLFLAVASALWAYSPLRHLWNRAEHSSIDGVALADDAGARNAALAAALAAASVVYPLARRFAPEMPETGGLALRFPGLEEGFPISYAALVAIAGAIVVLFPTGRVLSGLTRAVALALGALAFFAAVSFQLLRPHYPVGATEVLDPTPLVHLGMQVVEFGALAILCHAAVAHAGVRRWLLRLLPLVLLGVLARHHFVAPPAEEE
jgi:hypothetical protein